eukprot:49501-Hanusia_phi.AAC.3
MPGETCTCVSGLYQQGRGEIGAVHPRHSHGAMDSYGWSQRILQAKIDCIDVINKRVEGNDLLCFGEIALWDLKLIYTQMSWFPDGVSQKNIDTFVFDEEREHCWSYHYLRDYVDRLEDRIQREIANDAPWVRVCLLQAKLECLDEMNSQRGNNRDRVFDVGILDAIYDVYKKVDLVLDGRYKNTLDSRLARLKNSPGRWSYTEVRSFVNDVDYAVRKAHGLRLGEAL